jgi:ABC-type dipeptide/oligopeptide/nickel transport system ATPase component
MDVLVEKPHRIPGQDPQALAEAIASSGKRYFVGMTTRHWPGVRAAARAAADGRLGRPLAYTDRIAYRLGPSDLAPWYFDPKTSGGGALLTNGVLCTHRPELRRQSRRMVLESLESVGIRDPGRVYRSYPHQLSGGLRQRVMIAMAVAAGPRLLIADEPTSALDVTVQAAVLDMLGALADERGMSVLMITHDMGVVARFCDEVNVMYAGEVVESGPVADVLTAPRHDYTKSLLAAVPRVRPAPVPGDTASPPDEKRRVQSS